MILTKSLKNSRCSFLVKMQACGNKIDFCSFFFNIFVDFKKTELFIYFFVLILSIIMTFVFAREGWGMVARLNILLTFVGPVLLSAHFLTSRRFWIYSFIVRTVYAHNFAEKSCLVILVASYFEGTCLRKKLQGLFYFKIKIYLFWIEKRVLKNSNELD